MDSNLVRRVAFAAVAIPLALGVVWYGGMPLALLVSAIAWLGTRELFDLARRQGIQAARAFGLGIAALLPILTYLERTWSQARNVLLNAWPYLGALAVLGVMTWALWRRAPTDRPLPAVSVTFFGVLYAAALPTFLLDIRFGGFGDRSWTATWLVFFPLVVTWVCDTAAMFAGRAIGGAKLAPVVSPGKTRVGAVAGVVGAVAVAPLYNPLALAPHGIVLSPLQALAFAGILSVVGQVGDLAESLFKREVGQKDSSALIPGHGGVLDRFDSLYFVLPVAAMLYRLFGVA